MESKAVLACLVFCVVLCRVQANCPPYWTENAGSCYRYIGLADLYSTAESVCNMFAGCGSGSGVGHLVSINSVEENVFIFGFLANIFGEIPPAPSWLGLSDNNPQEIFTWSDGTIPTFNAWGPNSPRRMGQPNCAIFAELVVPRWTDIPCEEEPFPYICEMSAGVHSACPAGGNPAGPAPLLTNPNAPTVVRYSDGLPQNQ